MQPLSRRRFLTYGGAGVGGLLLTRGLTGCGFPLESGRVFSGSVTLSGGFTVPEGETWTFDPNRSTTVAVDGNVVVEGTLRMRPNPDVVHTLRFVDVDEAAFVGGHTDTPLASDVGMWVVHDGKLDAQGSPRRGWNRTGDDPTWVDSDELIVAPNGSTDPPPDPLQFESFTKGAPIPSVIHAGVVYKTEVANLTRNVRIEGTASGKSHVQFLHSTVPQTIKYVQFRHMGPQKFVGDTKEVVAGRYALHFHMNHDGSIGSVVEGCVVRDCGGPAYVSHISNGIHYTDCVAYRTTDKAYWWDDETSSDDISYDHCAAFGVRPKPKGNGFDALSVNGFTLAEGTNIAARDCVAAGCGGANIHAGGFHWPEKGGGIGVWTFSDCVSHGNRSSGVSVWQNDPHAVRKNLLERFVCYGNGVGLSHGAYVNNYTYRDAVCFANSHSIGSQPATDLDHRAAGGIFDRCRFDQVKIGHHQHLKNPRTSRYEDCTIGNVIVNEVPNAGPVIIEFRSTDPTHDLTLSDFDVRVRVSRITVHNSDGHLTVD